MVIVNTTTSYVIKLHGQYVLFSVALLVIGFIEHQGRCSPKEEGFVTSLVKIPCKKNIRPCLIGHVFQVEWWVRHPSVGVNLVVYG